MENQENMETLVTELDGVLDYLCKDKEASWREFTESIIQRTFDEQSGSCRRMLMNVF